MRREPHPVMAADVVDQRLQQHHARPVPDVMRMHGQQEQTGFRISAIELTLEDIQHPFRRRIGPQRRPPVHVEIDRVVAYPFDGQFHDTGGLAVL